MSKWHSLRPDLKSMTLAVPDGAQSEISILSDYWGSFNSPPNGLIAKKRTEFPIRQLRIGTRSMF
jgi:hypothetical protein